MNHRPYYNGPCVYVITAKETPDIFKIGCTSSLASRFNDLRAELKLDLSVVCYIPFDASDMRRRYYGLERILHKRFADKHVGNEWFELTADDITAIQREYSHPPVHTTRRLRIGGGW